MKQELKDRFGRLHGWTEEISGIVYIRDKNGRNLGTYNSKTNKTLDMSGNLIGYGNWLVALLK